MKVKSSKIFKIIAVALCFFMVFEQSGFAQIAGQLDISGRIAAFSNSIVQDKFRPLHLRYLQYDPQLNNFNLLLDKGNLKTLPKPFIEESTRTLLQYFFVGVTLPNDAFWVNLKPDSPDNIIDPFLAQTDIGKILLEADVQLKKDTARFTSPETPEGKEYWDKLYVKAGEIFGSQNVTIPTLTRPWIVPNEIIIRETADNAYIYKATLKVMLEEDYLKGSAVYNFQDERAKELNTYASQILREKIIPKLAQEVNTSKRYAGLRQVYYSLILAQWFKQRFANKGGTYSNLIDRKNLNGLISKESWSKTTYFQQYQKSFKDGEYNFRVPVTTPFGQTIRSYFSGGIAIGEMVALLGTTTMLANGGSFTSIISNRLVNFLDKVKSLLGVNVKSDGSVEASNVESVVQPSASQPNPGAQVSHVKNLDRLLRILNVLRKSENVLEISETAYDREIIEFCINELKAQGLIEETTDEDGNRIIKIKKEAVDNRLAQAIREWAINPVGGVQAINFLGTGEAAWIIVGFASELDNKDTLEHEQKEIAYRKQGLSWQDAHNKTVEDTGIGTTLDRTVISKYKAGQPDEIGAINGTNQGINIESLINNYLLKCSKSLQESKDRLAKFKKVGLKVFVKKEESMKKVREKALSQISKLKDIMKSVNIREFIRVLKEVDGGAVKELSSRQEFALTAIKEELKDNLYIDFNPEEVLFVSTSSWLRDFFEFSEAEGKIIGINDGKNSGYIILIDASIENPLDILHAWIHETMHKQFRNGADIIRQVAPEERRLFRILEEALVEQWAMKLTLEIYHRRPQLDLKSLEERLTKIIYEESLLAESYSIERQFLEKVLNLLGDKAGEAVFNCLKQGDLTLLRDLLGRRWEKIVAVTNIIENSNSNLYYLGLYIIINSININQGEDKLDAGIRLLNIIKEIDIWKVLPRDFAGSNNSEAIKDVVNILICKAGVKLLDNDFANLNSNNIRNKFIEYFRGLAQKFIELSTADTQKQPFKRPVVVPQIGKCAKAEITSEGKLKVTDSKGNVEGIDLTLLGDLNISSLKSQIESTQDIDIAHKQLILSILSLLEKSPPKLYSFSTLIEDLFGFASSGHNLIALHKDLIDNPIALFHEAGEYLISIGILNIQLKEDVLIVSMNDKKFALILEGETLAIANKDPNNPHYLLRALQREMFAKKDGDLTQEIKNKISGEVEVPKSDKGGIDFRALPITTQSLGAVPFGNSPYVQPVGIILSARLDKEWSEIENMLNGDIIPSIERLKEYLSLSCKSADCQARIDQALSGIADILRMEEERSSSTDTALKQLLVLLESNKSANELLIALLDIQVLAKAPH